MSEREEIMSDINREELAMRDEQYWEMRREHEKALNIRTEAKAAVDKLIHLVNEGWLSSDEVYLAMHTVAAEADRGLKAIKEKVMSELPDAGSTKFGLCLSKKNGGGSYAYNDPEYIDAKTTIKEMEEIRQMAYKASLKGSVVTDPNTGEIVPPAEWKPRADTIAVTKEKKS